MMNTNANDKLRQGGKINTYHVPFGLNTEEKVRGKELT